MLPVGTKPLIMHAVDEALEAGASRIIIPCRPEDEELFNKQFFGSEGRREIIQQNKRDELLDEGNAFANVVEVVPIYAKEGPASTIAELVQQRGIGNFGVILPDDLIVGERGALKQMMESFEQTGMPTIGTREVEAREKSSNVTFVKMEEREDGAAVTTTVQIKPKKDNPVSKNATAGRYIFTADYVDTVEAIDKDGLKEVSMSAVVRHYAQNDGVGVAQLKDATFYDCGEMGGYMRATAAFMDADVLRERFMEQNPNVSFLQPRQQQEGPGSDADVDHSVTKASSAIQADDSAKKNVGDASGVAKIEEQGDESARFFEEPEGHTSVDGQHQSIEMSNGVSVDGDTDIERHDLSHIQEPEVKAGKEEHGLN